jgi:hypothetical protein
LQIHCSVQLPPKVLDERAYLAKRRVGVIDEQASITPSRKQNPHTLTLAFGAGPDQEFSRSELDKIAALTSVLQDPSRTDAEKQIAARALRSVNEEFVAPTPQVTDATCAMLATLKVRSVADLNEDIYERHITAHSLNASDPIVREFRRWVPPSGAFLASIGMTLPDWWNA